MANEKSISEMNYEEIIKSIESYSGGLGRLLGEPQRTSAILIAKATEHASSKILETGDKIVDLKKSIDKATEELKHSSKTMLLTTIISDTLMIILTGIIAYCTWINVFGMKAK